jgi:hypothetical protein
VFTTQLESFVWLLLLPLEAVVARKFLHELDMILGLLDLLGDAALKIMECCVDFHVMRELAAQIVPPCLAVGTDSR